MGKTITITWVFLLVLTITTALISEIKDTYISVLILILAALKFTAVSFQFMELKKAHLFWKILILSYLLLFIALIIIIF
ncbi:cytochrome C oxidase subunit IV family protein [Flagellimonas pacifica]|uniref:Cytochrome C oxidase subunit IV n=1 Tax=Flagellimonas pacifica TaxID=1247520 RepID=A0A285MWH1_9FLAO|nr:cytochrome C oxidase subunit IV family protein [Allomuricauda parva]SNZ01458.1 Cytochrome C oxidase subunit IV [Allomuricauda parva]